MKKSLLPVLLILLVFLVFPFGSNASTFNNIVAYGDSLTDDGTSPSDSFGIQRFTNDKVWVEYLANSMGSTLYDAAFGGATTGMDNPAAGSPVLGLQWQLSATLPSLKSLFTDNTLVTVWAGANDFLQGRPFDLAAQNIGIALETLYINGARDILVGNLPDMGLTPAMYNFANHMGNPLASWWTSGFNAFLESQLLAFENVHSDANIYRLDAYGIFSNYQPETQAWLDLFWAHDGFHPSNIGHQLIFETAAAAIPEPATMTLFSLGLLSLAGVSRKQA